MRKAPVGTPAVTGLNGRGAKIRSDRQRDFVLDEDTRLCRTQRLMFIEQPDDLQLVRPVPPSSV
jgi:hypothetical protein